MTQYENIDNQNINNDSNFVRSKKIFKKYFLLKLGCDKFL